MNKELKEATAVTVYKRLVNILGEYNERYGLTGLSSLFQKAVDNGVKIVPKDKLSLAILHNTIAYADVPTAIQHLINIRFSDLPFDIRPIIKAGRRKEIAFWNKDGKICDKIIDLIDFDGKAKGYWCDVNGNKVTVLYIKEEEYVGVIGD